MLIGFLGPPISGKTTTAAKLFAGLKDDGYVAEFLPEQARSYIAYRRYHNKIYETPESPLTNEDQRKILQQQSFMEKVFISSSPKSLIITDCSAFMALLYMTERCRNEIEVLKRARESAKRFDLLFRCHPVKAGELYDPNRVHSFEQSQELDKNLDSLITLVRVPPENLIELSGPSHVRASRARFEVSERMACQR